MGSAFSSKKPPPVIAECKAPVYCVKKMGSRHLLVAGGGGAAKTGVLNNIEALLLSFDGREGKFPIGAHLTTQFSTGIFATMNLDIIAPVPTHSGIYLIAAGHDQYCDIYETVGFNVTSDGTNITEKSLGFKLREVARLTTDEKVENSYQKCVRFDKSRNGQRLATGGSDGHVRIWDIKSVAENRDPTIRHIPIVDIAAHRTEVDDIDISPDGTIVAALGDGKAIFWDSNTGKQVFEVPTPKELHGKCRVRSLRFTPHGQGSTYVFVMAFNEIQRTSKSCSYITLFSFNKERSAARLLAMREVPRQAISCINVSSCGDFTGVGTMGGSVGIFDTHELKQLAWEKETHGIFVTGLEFIERTASDISPDQKGLFKNYPGPAASWRVGLVSLSADQTVQLHTIPLTSTTPLTTILFWVSLFVLFFQMLFFFVRSA